MLCTKVYAEGKTDTNINELLIGLVEAFEKLDQDYIKNLYHSMA